jgi:uncharacterized protein (TIGR02391 family)
MKSQARSWMPHAETSPHSSNVKLTAHANRWRGFLRETPYQKHLTVLFREIMSSIYELMPDYEALLDLEPEELAGVILEYLNSIPNPLELTRYHFGSLETVEEYPSEHQESIRQALIEGWVWLENEGLIALSRAGSYDGGRIFITRQGRKLKKSTDLEVYCRANLLPKKLLHPIISQKVYHLFLRGDYDTAVFQAFKEVEVAVRDAGSYSNENYGTDLMRQAFHIGHGTLTDENQLESERKAVAHLFAGAIGLYKNPHSHRNVPVSAEEAVEIIMFASHLLRIVDSRSQMSTAP